MDTSTCLILVQIMSFISPSESHLAYTNEELQVLTTVATSVGVRSFIFVQDQVHVEVLEALRAFLDNNVFYAVVNSTRLDDILSDVVRKIAFFGDRLILVTKENLNFTDVIEKLSGLHTVTWVVFAQSLTAIRNSYIPVNTNFFIVQIASDVITIRRAYNLKPGLDISLENTGTLSKGGIPGAVALAGRKINFEKAVLNMLYVASEEECEKQSLNYVLSKMECFHQEIIKMTANRLNFVINKIDCLERQYPYNYPNGTLSDLFQILGRREADISSGSYIVTNDRLTSYDFVWPVFTTRSMMYIKLKGTEINWRAYARPVSRQVWNAIATWIVITGALIHFSDQSRTGNFKLRFSLVSELIKSVFASLQVFCNQGVHNISEWYSDRTVFMLTYLLFISLYQAYTGCLISSLTIATPSFPFTNLEEFFRDGTYKIMTVRSGFHNFYLKAVIQEMKMESRGLMIDDSSLPLHTRSGITTLCAADKIVYVEFRENIVHHEIPCKIMELPKSMLQRSIGIGLPKNSPYRQIISQEVNTLRSAGIMHRMRKYLLSYVKLQQREVSNEEYIKVTIGHVLSIFFILGSGMVIAVGILFLEVVGFYSMKFYGSMCSSTATGNRK